LRRILISNFPLKSVTYSALKTMAYHCFAFLYFL